MWLVAGGLGLWWFMRKKSAGDQIKWQIQGIDLKKLSLKIQLINPTNTPILFSAYVAELYMNNSNVGVLDYRNQITIAANGSNNISIPIKLNPIAAVTALPAIIRAKSVRANWRLKGTLNAENIAIPFDQPVNFA